MKLDGDFRRTIQHVVHGQSGAVITSSELIRMGEKAFFDARHDAERGIQTGAHRYVCGLCSGAVKLCAESSEHVGPYFQHVHAAPNCAWYLGKDFTKQQLLSGMYHGIAESDRHRNLKLRIRDLLIGTYGSEVVHCEERVTAHKPTGGWEWRKPDLLIEGVIAGRPLRLAIELQISNTFLSVIMARQEFYKRHGIHLLWVFDHFPGDLTKLYAAQKDIYYLNNANAYVFDPVMDAESAQHGALRLRCHSRRCHAVEPRLEEVNQAVTLEDLIYDDARMLAFVVDGEAEEQQCERLRVAAQWRADAHTLLATPRVEESSALTISQLLSEREQKLQRHLGLAKPLNSFQHGIFRTIASLCERRVIGWRVPNIIQMLYTHLQTVGTSRHPKYEAHRMLVISAMKVWMDAEVQKHSAEKTKRSGSSAKKTLVDLVRDFWKEIDNPLPTADDQTFYDAIRPYYPALFAKYDELCAKRGRA